MTKFLKLCKIWSLNHNLQNWASALKYVSFSKIIRDTLIDFTDVTKVCKKSTILVAVDASFLPSP